MSDPFVGEIRIFSGGFVPVGWAECNGQLLSIYNNTALFSLLGTTYGGDGKTTFALPDFGGRSPMHPGYGPGLTPRIPGQQVGSPSATGGGQVVDAVTIGRGLSHEETRRSVSIMANPGGQSRYRPALALRFIIALQGVYPPRS